MRDAYVLIKSWWGTVEGDCRQVKSYNMDAV